MSDPNSTPPPGAADVIASALTAAGFDAAEATALVDQALAARAPAPAPPRTVSTPAGAAAARTYTLAEIQEFGRALGLGGAAASPGAPAVPAGPPITSRAAPPPASAPSEDTPIQSMSESDRRAYLSKLVGQHGHEKGNTMFADRMLREMVRDNVRVRSRDR